MNVTLPPAHVPLQSWLRHPSNQQVVPTIAHPDVLALGLKPREGK